MAVLLKLLIAIAEAIPAAKELLSQWSAHEIAKWNQEKRDGLRKLLNEHDQRDLEKALGNPKAGEPSGDAGAVVKPGLPPIVHH